MSITPLPWEFKRANDGLHSHRITGNGLVLADVWWKTNTCHAPAQKEAEANASVIAAAPELLQALSEIAAYPVHVAGYNSPSAIALRMTAVKTIARAAIAKAEGRKP